MTVKVIRGEGQGWRPFRFPPRLRQAAPADGDPARCMW